MLDAMRKMLNPNGNPHIHRNNQAKAVRSPAEVNPETDGMNMQSNMDEMERGFKHRMQRMVKLIGPLMVAKITSKSSSWRIRNS